MIPFTISTLWLALLVLHNTKNASSLVRNPIPSVPLRDAYRFMCATATGDVGTADKLTKLVNVITECISRSKVSFVDGTQYAMGMSNGKDQMGTWVEDALKANIVREMNTSAINTENQVYQSISKSLLPISVSLFSSQEMELTLFYIPVNTTLPPRVHASGTLLMYMSMQGGNGQVRSILSTGREIGVDHIENMVLQRIGGPARVLQGAPHSSTVIMELAIHPPRIEDNILEDPFGSRSVEVMKLLPSVDASRSLLEEKWKYHLQAIQQKTLACINYSLGRNGGNDDIYTSSSSSSNNPFAVGTWLDIEHINKVLSVIQSTTLNVNNSVICDLKQTTTPVVVPLFLTEECELSLLVLPGNSTMPPRNHMSGTLLIYQSLPETVASVRTFVLSREISVDFLESVPMKRLGGPNRAIKNDRLHKPAFVLEMAIFPPTGTAFGDALGSTVGSRFVERENEVDILDLPVEERYSLLDDKKHRNKWSETGYKETIASSTKIMFDDRLSFLVGGLGKEINEIRRRVLLSRQLDQKTMSALGISHVKGILLYGSPGTGKTLLAREISKVLNAREPKVINGPEVLDKYVGEAERNIRLLFKEAEEEWAAIGEKSALHVLIFDEFDAIAKRRGSLGGDDSGVRDSVVNQLLSKMDGVGELRNILVIGLTNRKDLIDDALLRPGRFEVHLEINPPNLAGRQEILAIQLRAMVQGQFLSVESAAHQISLLSEKTAGWSGADLAGLVRSAVAFALDRCLDISLPEDISENQRQISTPAVSLLPEDFSAGYEEIKKVKDSGTSLVQKASIKMRRALGRLPLLKSILRRLSYSTEIVPNDDGVNKPENIETIKYILAKQLPPLATNTR